jgi:topoisomerase-4 subunit A
MKELKLASRGMPKKSARVVGDVIGKYHPHGDTAVYDALVRLAQDFSVRYPLIYGQGNFGNIDGDNAAAMRYTEAKLTNIAEAMLDGIDEDTVDFRETYDGEGREPIVLPAAFPNLLANGATGIAVGMATSIPPHNVDEICRACERLIDDPELSVRQIMRSIPGPDFPTGGVLAEDRDSIATAYETGRGSFKIRAKWSVEDLGQGKYQIIVTEIPYQIQKAGLIEKIADLVTSKELPLLDDVRDESAEDVRIVLIPKSRNVDPDLLMEALFKNTPLEHRITLNMNVLEQGRVPKVMSLKEVLQAFLNHRHDVLVRRSEYRVRQIDERLEVLNGYLTAFLHLDEVIEIIRFEDDPKSVMMERFELNKRQAEAILNMRLRRLRKLEEEKLKQELQELTDERADLDDLLTDQDRRWQVIKTEMEGIRDQFGKSSEFGDRRTEITGEVEEVDIPLAAMIEKEPVTILCSQRGWIRILKGHVDAESSSYKDGDAERFILHAYTTDQLILFADNGRSFTLQVNDLPGGRGYGEPVNLMVNIDNQTDLVDIMIHEKDARYVLASSDGRGFIITADDILAQTVNGKRVLKLPKNEKAAACVRIREDDDHIAVIGDGRRLLVFPIDTLSEMSKGRGLKLQDYKDGGLADITTFNLADGLKWSMGDRVRHEEDMTPWLGNRADRGSMPPHGFPRDNQFQRPDGPKLAQ